LREQSHLLEAESDCGGLFLFVPFLLRLPLETLAAAAHLPGSTMIPAAPALRCALALKLLLLTT
jgi:hypothetical protein